MAEATTISLTCSGGPQDGQTVWVSPFCQKIAFVDGSVYVRQETAPFADYDEILTNAQKLNDKRYLNDIKPKRLRMGTL
jgi:hypothetical protein